MTKFDMWYGDKVADADRIDCLFYPEECEYRGNLYKGKKCIGDYVSSDCIELADILLPLGFMINFD